MTKTVGRNEKCPCGSGKKYKYCCLVNCQSFILKNDIDEAFNRYEEDLIQSEIKDVTGFFSTYDNVDLLSKLSILHITPKNHSKNIRLEEITRQALISDKGALKKISSNELREIIHKNFPSHHLEDPPENLFTENIMTPFGNRIVYTGIAEGQVLILQQLIDSIFRDKSCLTQEIKLSILGPTYLLLSISNYLAKSMKHSRNMFVEYELDRAITIPENITLIELSKQLILTKEVISSIFNDYEFKNEWIDDFVLDLGNPLLQNDDNFTNPILQRPIVKKGNYYILIGPTTIIYACLNNIWYNAIRLGFLHSVKDLYEQHSWKRIVQLLQNKGYALQDYQISSTKLPVMDGIFGFDSNKILYLEYILDDCSQIDPCNPIMTDTHELDEKEAQKISKRRENLLKGLQKDKSFNNYEIYRLTIINGIGRGFSLLSSIDHFVEIDGFKDSIILALNDLNIIFQHQATTKFSIWNYLEASQKLTYITPFILDNIAMFLDNDNSFYISDESTSSSISVGVGTALSMKFDTINAQDKHLVQYKYQGQNIYVPVIRIEYPSILPIYSSWYSPNLPYFVLTEVLGVNVFIQYRLSTKENGTINKQIMHELSRCVAYWMYSLSKRFNQDQIAVENKLNFNISFQPKSLKANIGLEEKNPPACLGKFHLEENTLLIELDEYLILRLTKSDNSFEKSIMSEVFQYFMKWFEQFSQVTLNIQSILDCCLPLGSKKMLFLYNSQDDCRLSPENLSDYVKLPSYYLNSQIDDFGLLLRNVGKAEGQILGREDCLEELKQAVEFYTDGLEEILKRYDVNDVVSIFLMYYESSIQRRMWFNKSLASKIECFIEDVDVKNKLISEDKGNNQVSIAIRCLIEKAIYMNYSGDSTFNQKDFDKAIAYMINVIEWASIRDSIYYNIDNPRVKLLKSGRLGISYDYKESKRMYFKDKFEERIIFSKEAYNPFKLQESVDEEKFKIAFLSEFGFSYDSYTNLLSQSIDIAFNFEGSVYLNSFNDFKRSVRTDSELNQEELEAIIQAFSLKPQENSDVDVRIYEQYEYHPWRFKRKFSLFMKPYILLNKNGIEQICFGARELQDSMYYLSEAITLGKYKARSKTMISYIGRVNDLRGKHFNEDVYNFLSKYQSSEFIVEKEMKICPTSVLKSKKDLGDIDIIIVSKERKFIIALECKQLILAKTPYEQYGELKKFIPWDKKVTAREKWLNANIDLLGDSLSLDSVSEYKLKYMFLTNQIIPVSYLESDELNHRFLSFNSIKQDFLIMFEEN